MRILTILTVLLLIGCSGEITGEAIKELDFLDCADVLVEECPKTCPECQVCEECPTCPKCKTCKKCEKCPKCPDRDNPVEIDLDSMKLSKRVKPDVEEHEQKFKITAEQYSSLNDAELSFESRCTDTDARLRIKVNSKVFYNKVPECGEKTKISFQKRDLKSGDNLLSFESDVSESYRLNDIELDLGDDTDTIEFDDVWLEKRIVENIQIDELADVRIQNFVELKVKLSKNDVKQDLILEFDADKQNGRLIIVVNKREVFDGTPDDDNKIVIDNKHLDDGTNTFKFIGLSK